MGDTNTFVTESGIRLSAEAAEQELAKLQCYSIPADRLQVQRKAFATGSYGVVKMATLLPLADSQDEGITVVVKELRVDTSQVIPLRAAYRLIRETMIWSTCQHPNILKFLGYHLGEDFNPAYLISPHMKNGNIKHYLATNQVDSPRLLELVRDTISGLRYLHSQNPPIIHGGLKAANVLLSDSQRALLCDFGLAAVMQDFPTGYTASRDFKESIRWCSPEMLSENKRTSVSDIWAWGCLVLEMMTKELPYNDVKNENFIPVVMVRDYKTPEPNPEPTLPSGILNLLRTCWDFDPKKRPDALGCLTVVGSISLTPAFRPSLGIFPTDLPEEPAPHPPTPRPVITFPGESYFQLDPTVVPLIPSQPTGQHTDRIRKSHVLYSACKCEGGLTSKPARHWQVCPYNPEAGEKPFVCEVCDERFSREDNKRRHVKQYHPGTEV